MDARMIEQTAAMALLDRGVGFQIPAPFFFRWLGKKKVGISVKRLRLGTLLHISRLVPPEELAAPQPPDLTPNPSPRGEGKKKEFEERKKVIEAISGEAVTVKLEFIRKNAKNVCRAVACGLLNSELKIRLFARLLGKYLQNACTPDQLQELTLWLFAYGRAESFTNTTKFLRTMRMTTPRNLGPTEERS